MPRSTGGPAPGASNNAAITEIERLGFTWKEEAQYDLGRLDDSRRIQVREVGHYVPKENVASYAEQMGHSQFPPIVVTLDDWLADGNTRAAAAGVRGQKFFPAYVIQVEYAGPTTTKAQQDALYALAATLNAQNGQRLEAGEVRKVVRRLIGLDWNAENIGRAVGVKPPVVTAIRKEIDAEAKLTKVGLDANGSLKGASLRALGNTTALALNDEPYKALATLAADAGLNATEIGAAAKDAKATGSDVAAIEYLATQRNEMADRIRQRELTGVGKPPLARQARQHLGFINKFEGKEQELLEHNPDPEVVATHTRSLQTTIAVATKVLELQAMEVQAAS